MSVLTLARLNSEEASKIIKEVKKIRDISYTELCDLLEIPRESEGRLKKQVLSDTKFKDDEIARYSVIIEKNLTDAEWLKIRAALPDLYRRIVAPSFPIPNTMADWMDVMDDQRNFADRRTNSNGSFLIIRLHRDGGLMCSWMLIRGPSGLAPISQFLTQRPVSNGVKRCIRGVIFQKSKLIFSFGKSRHGDGFRSAFVRPINRGTDRFDMFGIRSGLQNDPEEVPYAYPIYCYQLKKQRDRHSLYKLTGQKAFTNRKLRDEIVGLDDIIGRLKEAAQYDFGVLG